jgi:DNA-damage-inducible protein D
MKKSEFYHLPQLINHRYKHLSAISIFEGKRVRSAWNASEGKWVFMIDDIISILADSPNSSRYGCVMKKRLTNEGSETVTICNGMKMRAADGKQPITDVADTKQLLRLIQSIPSLKARQFKRWLAKIGYERLEEIETPQLAPWSVGILPTFQRITPSPSLLKISSI